MPEPLNREDVLAKLAFEAKFARSQGSELTAAGLDAIAAWLQSACVVEGGHQYDRDAFDWRPCRHCGQRRAAAVEGGR